MPFAIVKNEKTIEELAARLFSVDGKLPKTVAKQAVAALLKLNPQLKEIGVVPAGSLVVIPDTAPPVVPSELVQGPPPTLAAAAGRVQERLSALEAQLVAIDAHARDAAQSLTKLGKAQGTQLNTANNAPDMAKLLAFSVKPVRTIAKNLEAAIKARGETFADLKTHLDALVQATGKKQ